MTLLERLEKAKEEMKVKDLREPVILLAHKINNPEQTLKSLIKYVESNLDRKTQKGNYTFEPYMCRIEFILNNCKVLDEEIGC